jgi:hypothetical protein
MARILDVALRISASAGALMPSWLINAAVSDLPPNPTVEEIAAAFSRLAHVEIVRANFQPTDPFLKGSMRMTAEYRAAKHRRRSPRR